MISIGPYQFDTPLILAPMAGVTDQPFRKLCRQYGASMCVSEMVIADPSFWKTRKSKHRLDHRGESGPISVQIAGGDAQMLAEAARLNEERGAQIIDINMGCPAKKVCNKAAGSALMKDEKLVAEIIKAVVGAVSIPVTLKTRTGWDTENKNVPNIAHIAESEGISALAIHGRTRACAYKGSAEYDTIAKVKQNLSIPLFANGDITTPEKAKAVLDYTNADGLLIGRGAQGKPWIFNEIRHYLETGTHLPALPLDQQHDIVVQHVSALHRFYGDIMGVRIARKHVAWYLSSNLLSNEEDECLKEQEIGNREFRKSFNQINECDEQIDSIHDYFSKRIKPHDFAPSLHRDGQHSSEPINPSRDNNAAELTIASNEAKDCSSYSDTNNHTTHLKKEEKAA